MKFNKQKLKNIGIEDMTAKELIGVMQNKMLYIMTHNKNYTQVQWHELMDVSELLNCLE